MENPVKGLKMTLFPIRSDNMTTNHPAVPEGDGRVYPTCTKEQWDSMKSQNEKVKWHGHTRFYELLEQMADLHSRKNHDYAGTGDPFKNFKACERINLDPFVGVITRMQDKWSRIESFIREGTLEVKGESVIDTLMDNAVYSLIAIILYEESEVDMDKLNKVYQHLDKH